MSDIRYPKEWWDFKGLTPPPTEEKYVDPPEEEVVRIITRIITTYMPCEETHYEEHDKPEGHIYLDLLTLKKGLDNHELSKS
jgi:hypothetical protein